MRFVCIVVKNRLTKSALILTVHLTDPQDYTSCCVSLGHCAKASLNVLSSYKIKFINENVSIRAQTLDKSLISVK